MNKLETINTLMNKMFSFTNKTELTDYLYEKIINGSNRDSNYLLSLNNIRMNILSCKGSELESYKHIINLIKEGKL